MSSMCDTSWINQYIGVPYVHGGADLLGFDCYGLLALVYRERLGVELPTWNASADTPQAAHRALLYHIGIEIDSGRAYEVPYPEDYDIAVVKRRGHSHHVGVFLYGGILHAERGYGSRFELLDSFLSRFSETIFYRWEL